MLSWAARGSWAKNWARLTSGSWSRWSIRQWRKCKKTRLYISLLDRLAAADFIISFDHLLMTTSILAAFWQPPCVRLQGGRFTQARCKSLSQDSGLTEARASADRTVAPHVADNSDTVGCSCRRVTEHGIASLGRSRHSLTLLHLSGCTRAVTSAAFA